MPEHTFPASADVWVSTRVFPGADAPVTLRATLSEGGVGTLVLAEVLSQDETSIDITVHGVVEGEGEDLTLTVASAALSAATRAGTTGAPIAPAPGFATPGLYVLFRAGANEGDLNAIVESRVKVPGPGPGTPAGIKLQILGEGRLVAEESGFPFGTLPADAIFSPSVLWRDTSTSPSIPGPRLHAIVAYEGDYEDTEGSNTTILATRNGTGITTHIWWESAERAEGYTIGFVNASDLEDESGTPMTFSWYAGGAQQASGDVVVVTTGSAKTVDLDLAGGTIGLSIPWATP